MKKLINILIIAGLALSLQGCWLLVGTGAVVGTAVGVSTSIAKTTVKTAGKVAGAAV